MTQLFAIAIGLGLASGIAGAQDPTAAIRGLDSAWARAYATHDTTLALSLFDENLVVTSVGGSLKDRAGELGDIRAQPNLKMEYFRTSDFAVRIHEGTAVVTGLAQWRYTMNAQVSNPRRRYTAVYVRGGPMGWRMLALHMGRAPEG